MNVKLGRHSSAESILLTKKEINKQTKQDTNMRLCKCARKMEAHMDKLIKKNINTLKKKLKKKCIKCNSERMNKQFKF